MFCFLVYHTSNVLIVLAHRGRHRLKNWMLLLLSSKIVWFGIVVIERLLITFSTMVDFFFSLLSILNSVAHIWTSQYFFSGCLKVFWKVRHFWGAVEQCIEKCRTFQGLFKSASKSAPFFRGFWKVRTCFEKCRRTKQNKWGKSLIKSFSTNF